MIDKFCTLVLGEEGLIVNLRAENRFDEKTYSEIRDTLKILVNEWKIKDSIPKKAFLAIIELIDTLVGNNKFLTEEDSIKVEDASLEIKDILNELL